ncbi:MAG: alpha-galactosidase, partial [Verrucomicrobia bacterium]|nr:alpha-galactosidase [Verrucomicrobiota bacterium]
MRTLLTILPATILLNFSGAAAWAVSPSAAEIGIAREFAKSTLTGTNASPPFSFFYDGKSSAELLPTWNVRRQIRPLDSGRTEETITYTDPKTGLEARCVAIQQADFPVVEWTLYFKNTSGQDTPILADIQALDIKLQRGGQGEFLLHHANGSQAQVNDFQPLLTTLSPNSDTTIAPNGGRPSNGNLPYFNIEWPGAGVIMAVGWPGQWQTRFVRDATNGLRVCAGQQMTHFTLHPGEEVRSPLLALLFYQGGWIRSQNLWRRWMVADNLPRLEGKPLQPAMFACSSHQFGEMIRANEQNQKLFIKRYLEEGLKIDYWWMDAGWYVNNGSWVNTGTWEVDRKRFPHGLRAVSDYAHARGVNILVWFEPERVTPETWL